MRAKVAAGVLALIALVGCRSSSATSSSSESPDTAVSFTPSPLLALARSEREVPPVRTRWLRQRWRADEALTPSSDPNAMRREVRIHPFRLATPEELARASLRHAESRRPREMTPTRLHVRTRSVSAPTPALRRATRRQIDARDSAIATCLVADQAARTDVFLGEDAPQVLVLESAMTRGPVTYRLELSEQAVTVHPDVSATTQACLERATDRLPPDTHVRLTAFAQWAEDINAGQHRTLANEAATLGWIAYERGAHQEALAYFEDAHWLYHRPEYELLQAMALQELGRTNMALTRYRDFLEQRPDTLDTPRVQARIATLEHG